jgi:hypothetical protein
MRNGRSQLIVLGLVALVLVACATSEQFVTSTPGRPQPSPEDEETSTATHPAPPVYVTIAGHIEDTPIYAQCEAYPDFRQKLLAFAEAVLPTGAAVNLQIDYEFFLGTSRCETDEMRAATDGRNVIDYLATHYGFEIDAHQEGGWEEGQDNYADVRFLGGTLTPGISENVGGLVWDSPDQFARLARGEPGRINPDFTWSPQVLTLAVSRDHHRGDFSRDDIASGVWTPKGANENFWVHEPGERMVYVGPGEHANWNPDSSYLATPEFVRSLAEQLEQGTIERDRMYTASIAVPQSVIFSPEEHQRLLALLDQLAPLIESGQAVYVTYSQAVDIWREAYGARPNVFYRDGVDPPNAR